MAAVNVYFLIKYDKINTILFDTNTSMKLDDKISELWSRLGYHDYQLDGACHGFIIRWIEACLLGQSYQFDERKKLISELDIESFIIAIQRIKEKTKFNVSVSSEERHLINLLAFLESMLAFQSALIQKDLLGFSRLRDIYKISAIASTEEIYQNGGLVTCELEAGNYSKTDLEAWLERYESVIKKIDTPQNVFVFSLSNEVHTIGVMYQKITENWQVEDLQNIEMSNVPSASKQKISEQIYIGLKIKAADQHAYLSRIKFFRKELQVIEEQANEKRKNQGVIFGKDSFEIGVSYNVETKKWRRKGTDQTFELEVMADYLALWFLGFTEPCPYINMAITMYLTQSDENSHGIMQKFQQQLLPYEPSEAWLKRANAAYLIIVASQEGDIDLVKKLTEMHLYDDTSLSEAIFTSVQENDIEIVNVLMTLPNSKRLVNQISRSDSTPLIISIQNGHVAMTRLLLNLGANPNIFNSVGDSPLAMAAQEGYLEIINWLIEAKAILDKQNPQGATALSLAVGGNHIAVVKKLIQAGASVNTPNHRGITPLQKAVTLNYPVIAALLQIEISRNHTGLKKAIISDHFSHGFFGLKNQSGAPTELDIRRHFRGYS